jgi:transketolase
MAKDKRPNYMRLAREATPVFTSPDTPFEIGKAYIYHEGVDVTIIATGTMTYQALMAASELKKHNISAEVIHMPTIKPFDGETVLKSVKKTRAVVTAEEGQIIGGLGGAVAEFLSENHPVPMTRIGMKDRFGESGTMDELLEHFGLTSKQIVLSAVFIKEKKK